MNLDLDNLPKNLWIRREGETVIVGSERRPIALINLVPIFIALGMISVLILGLYRLDWVLLIIGLITGFIGTSILIAEFGAIEFRLKEKKGVFFQGIGKIGFKYSLVYKNINSFDWVNKTYGSDLIIIGKKEVPHSINIDNRNIIFIVNLLNAFIQNPSLIKNQLAADLSHHLVK